VIGAGEELVVQLLRNRIKLEIEACRSAQRRRLKLMNFSSSPSKCLHLMLAKIMIGFFELAN